MKRIPPVQHADGRVYEDWSAGIGQVALIALDPSRQGNGRGVVLLFGMT